MVRILLPSFPEKEVYVDRPYVDRAIAEVKSLCLTMVSAGLDTVPGNLVLGLAYLASEDGQRIQRKAYEEIMKVYPNNDAWEKCLVEEKVAYVTALVKEVLRFWTVIPICLPRKSIKDITWDSATIPAGTTFFMVSLDFLLLGSAMID